MLTVVREKTFDRRNYRLKSLVLGVVLTLSQASGGLTAFAQLMDGQTDDSSQNRPIKDKWAVVIGVSKFANPAVPQLRYAAKDAEDFRQFLIKREGFAPDHVLALTDETATKVNILEAFGDGWLPRRVMKDDLVVMFVSTHGSPADQSGENFIVAHDTDPDHLYATGIRLQDLPNELTRRTGCDRLVLLLDACHSGAVVNAQKGLVRVPRNFDLNTVTGNGQLVISSSSSDQVSWESKRSANGVFTEQLMQALQVKGAQTTLEDAFPTLQSGIATEVRFDRMADQTPVMLNKWKGSKLSLAIPPTEPRTVPSDPIEAPTVSTQNRSYQPPAATNQYPVASQSHRVISQPPPITTSETASLRRAVPASVLNESTSETYGGPMMQSNWTDNRGDSTLEKDTRLLSPSDLVAVNKRDLLYLYNEAYARHGRGFATADIQAHFLKQPWYRQDPDYHWQVNDPRVIARRGMTDDGLIINEKRTPKQWANMMLIKRVMAQR